MYLQESLNTPIVGEYEVAVCGGGIAGIAAALAAARLGKKTILIEKQFMLGGLGTAGLVTIYLPICDGKGRQVSFGLAEELLRLSVRHGVEGAYPANWLDGDGPCTETDRRFEVKYNPQLFAIIAEETLFQAGVEVLYGTQVSAVKVEEEKITHLVLENKSGRTAIAVRSVVDSTGDCDIAAFAGAPTENFKQGNVLAAWYYTAEPSGYNLRTLGFCDIPEEEKTENNDHKFLVSKRFLGLDGKELSEMTRLSHEQTYRDFLEKYHDKDGYLATMASIPLLRMTRRIVGEYELSDKEKHVYFDDSIGMVSDWKKRGPVYEVPFRTLYSAKVKNLVAAGRCTSVNETMWDIMRVIPCCSVTGQAAGTAAAISDDFTKLDVKILQKTLQDAGVVLHEQDIEN